jgi:hypothetical protein
MENQFETLLSVTGEEDLLWTILSSLFAEGKACAIIQSYNRMFRYKK